MNEEFYIDLLSPFELATLSNEHIVIATTNFALYLSLLSGYLVAAYLAGANLKKPQLSFVNTIFSGAAAYFAIAYIGNTVLSNMYSMALSRTEMAEVSTNVFLVFGFLLFLGMLIAIPFSIRFMRAMREVRN